LFINAGYYLTDDVEFYAFGSYSARGGEGGGFYRRAKDSRNVLASAHPETAFSK
jgi:iron complex outermembrane receptor protein